MRKLVILAALLVVLILAAKIGKTAFLVADAMRTNPIVHVHHIAVDHRDIVCTQRVVTYSCR